MIPEVAAEAAVGWDKAGSAAAARLSPTLRLRPEGSSPKSDPKGARRSPAHLLKVAKRVAVVGRRSLRELVPPYVSKSTYFPERKSFTALRDRGGRILGRRLRANSAAPAGA